jgi:effector-binding domain-containing protein
MSTVIKPKRSILSTILYILACFIVIVLIAGIFMPKDIKTSKTFDVEAPASFVYNLVNNQTTASKWNAWILDDETTALQYEKIKVGKDSGYSWKSKKNGDGTLKYTSVVPNEKIEADLIMGGEKSKSTQIFKDSKDGKSTLRWDFESHMSYPKNAFAPILLYMINKMNKKSVGFMEAEIKKRQQGEYYGYKVKEASQNQRHFVTSRSVISFDQISQFYAQNLAAIYQKLQAEGITAAGPPCAIFYQYDESKQTTDMAVAVPVLTPVAIKDLGNEVYPAQNAISVDYFGDSAKNQAAHYALNDYLNDRNYAETKPAIEEYVTDPLSEKDPSKWLTKIYYYISEKK